MRYFFLLIKLAINETGIVFYDWGNISQALKDLIMSEILTNTTIGEKNNKVFVKTDNLDLQAEIESAFLNATEKRGIEIIEADYNNGKASQQFILNKESAVLNAS